MTGQATSSIIGAWSSGGAQSWFMVNNPAAEQLLAQVAAAGDVTADDVIQAMRRAFLG